MYVLENLAMIKVLIVDDSSFMRVKIRSFLETCPDIKIVGIARNGLDAVEKTHILMPDVITMDINMPGLSGIQAVERIMRECPTRILIVSSSPMKVPQKLWRLWKRVRWIISTKIP